MNKTDRIHTRRSTGVQVLNEMAEKYIKETAVEFSSRLFEIISNGFTSLSIALGVKSGLFNVLVDHHDKPMTSQELADAAGLKERYVREWLGAMTTAYIVDLDPATEKYRLPPHRVDSFRSGTMTGQGADCFITIPIASEVFNRMLEVIKKDGPRGLTFSMAPNFHEYNDAYTLPWFNHCLVQDFIPSQPEIMSRLETGIRMLDIGCGHGTGVKNLAQRFPNSHFFGLDLDQCAVDWANKDAAHLELQNLTYVCADATAMPDDWTSTFDYIFFFNVLHDAPRPDLIIDDVKRVMKKGGIMSVIEMDGESKHADNLGDPNASFNYSDSLFYCLPMSYNFPDSLALGAMWGKDRIKEFLEGKGLTVKAVSQLPKLPQQVHFLSELM